jgi:hypothetical protein
MVPRPAPAPCVLSQPNGSRSRRRDRTPPAQSTPVDEPLLRAAEYVRMRAFRAEVCRGLRERGTVVSQESRMMLVVNGRRVAVLLTCRARSKGKPRWLVRFHINPAPDCVLVARLNPSESGVQDCCLEFGARSGVRYGVVHRKCRERIEGAPLRPLLDRICDKER